MKKLMLLFVLLFLVGCNDEAVSDANIVEKVEKEIASVRCETTSYWTEEVAYSAHDYDESFWHGGNYIMTYDDLGRLETYASIVAGPEGEENGVRKMIYNDKGEYTGFRVDNVRTMLYNDFGEYVGFYEDYGGGIVIKLNYEVDEDGKLIRDGSYVKSVRKIVDNGTVIQLTKETHILDDKDRVIGILEDGVEMRTHYFDGLERPIKVKRLIDVYEQGRKITDYEMSYDDRGDLALMTTSGHGGDQEYRYEYQYDEFGNWIERKTLLFGEYKYITTREITYRD